MSYVLLRSLNKLPHTYSCSPTLPNLKCFPVQPVCGRYCSPDPSQVCAFISWFLGLQDFWNGNKLLLPDILEKNWFLFVILQFLKKEIMRPLPAPSNHSTLDTLSSQFSHSCIFLITSRFTWLFIILQAMFNECKQVHVSLSSVPYPVQTIWHH